MRLSTFLVASALTTVVTPAARAEDKPVPAGLAALLDQAYDGDKPPEAVRMLMAIANGSQMGPGEGWFGPCETKYDWDWLVKRCGADPAVGIAKDQFPGKPEWFSRLDRNKDGVIQPVDIDWSDANPWVREAYTVNRLFRRVDGDGDGKLTQAEWETFFAKAAAGKDHLTSDDLRDTLLAGVGSASFSPGDAPSPAVLIRGLFSGEIGSLHEGPKVGQPAPDFVLKPQDGGEPVRLSQVIGRGKPAVLVFGNFTCGPFRSMYPGVEAVYRRFAADSEFLGVYVREAHPTDGWVMASNDRVGVAVKQPTTLTERVAAAGQFCAKLKPSFPFLVDEVTDPVGNAYSGMPARLYVIDRNGNVAYKSGRGPFGFKVGEMEQALAMSLIDEASPGQSPSGK